jgi:uncharacterized protein (DUF4415 family)
VEEAKPDTGADLSAEVEKWKAQARKHEERAKTNADAAKKLADFEAQHMTDTEKAIAVARAEAKAEALAESGGKIARAEVKAAAAGRLDSDALDALLEGLNLAVFLDEAGDVDPAKVSGFLDRIAPKADDEKPFPDLGQGARGGDVALNSDPLTKALKQAVGL